MFDQCRNAERPECRPTGLTAMSCQVIVSRTAQYACLRIMFAGVLPFIERQSLYYYCC